MEAPTLDRQEANRLLTGMSAVERVQWAVEQFGDQMVLLSSMQKTSSALMHIFHRLGLENDILFVDTGFHFHETLRIRDELIRRYRLNVVTLYPRHTPEKQEQLYGRKLHLFRDGQPECCEMRKERPFIQYMREAGRRVVLNGLRRSDGGKRLTIELLEADPRYDGYKLNPILDWTDAALDAYLVEHDVPVHPLHAKSYPSIGCECCTTPVMPGEDPRAGRWRHLRDTEGQGPQYCGINFSDGSGI
jgi:phosphoadenosine phosphosulfate reductase